jgi:UDP-GlcNAc:undecaprenyl-phosphate GlcNAc-1-phosphate transferase
VPRDIGVLALALLVVLLALYFKYRHKPFNIVERACAYIAGICVVYLVQLRPGDPGGLGVYCGILFAAMTLAVVIGFRVGAERFRITPMDFLVIFIALALPNLPDLNLKVEHLGLGVAMIIVLFYSIELVLNNLWRRWDVMRFTTYATLAVLGFSGIMGSG